MSLDTSIDTSTGNRLIKQFTPAGVATGNQFFAPLNGQAAGGLAFDTTDSTLWIGSLERVFHVTTTGAALGSFAVPAFTGPDGRLSLVDGLEFQSAPLSFITIADTGVTIPGGTGLFTAFPQSPVLSASTTTFIGTGSGQAGVYIALPPNPIQPIANLTTPIPNGTGTFTDFTALALAAIPQDPYRVAFIGTGSGQAGVYAAVPSNPIQPIANLSTLIPGGTGTFTGFTALALAAYPVDPMRVAFIGTGSGQAGVYAATPPDPIQPIADLTTTIPSGTGTFTGFTSISVSGQHTAFLGLGSNGQAGIYLASSLSKVIAVGDTLSGKTVAGLRLGRDGLDGINLAFTAVFTDGSEGVYTVRVTTYPYTGFFAPVDNLPVLNQIQAGQGVPVKFSLHGNQGTAIFAAGYPKSQSIACDATAPVDGIEETVTAGASSLLYDSATDRYIYVWKTDKAWAKSCRQLVVKLNDGTIHRANFSFK